MLNTSSIIIDIIIVTFNKIKFIHFIMGDIITKGGIVIIMEDNVIIREDIIIIRKDIIIKEEMHSKQNN